MYLYCKNLKLNDNFWEWKNNGLRCVIYYYYNDDWNIYLFLLYVYD